MQFLGIILLVAFGSMAIAFDPKNVSNDQTDHIVQVVANLSSRGYNAGYKCSHSCLVTGLRGAFNITPEPSTTPSVIQFPRVRIPGLLAPFPPDMPMLEEWVTVVDWIKLIRPIYDQFKRCLDACEDGELKWILSDVTDVVDEFYDRNMPATIKAVECVGNAWKSICPEITEKIEHCANKTEPESFHNETKAPARATPDMVRDSARRLCAFKKCTSTAFRRVLDEKCRSFDWIDAINRMMYDAMLLIVSKHHELPGLSPETCRN